MADSRRLTLEARGTREHILDAAVEVLARRGYSAAGVREIVDLSGTSKGSFYFHFPSKENMVIALVERMSDKLIARVHGAIYSQPTPLHRLAASINVLLATFHRQRKVAQILFFNVMGHGRDSDKKFLPIRERFSEMIQTHIEEAVVQREIPPVDSNLASQLWVGAVHEVILRWLLTGFPNPIMQVGPTLGMALLQSIGVSRARARALMADVGEQKR